MRPYLLTIALIFPVDLIGCPTTPTSPTFVHAPDTDLCPAMCAHFRELKCDEGSAFYDNDKPGPKGVPNAKCEDFCQRQQTNGVYVNPRCLTKVPSCNLIETWCTKDCKGDGGS